MLLSLGSLLFAVLLRIRAARKRMGSNYRKQAYNNSGPSLSWSVKSVHTSESDHVREFKSFSKSTKTLKNCDSRLFSRTT